MPTSTWPQRSAASQNALIAERVARHAHREIDQEQRRDRERRPRDVTQIAQKPGHEISSLRYSPRAVLPRRASRHAAILRLSSAAPRPIAEQVGSAGAAM